MLIDRSGKVILLHRKINELDIDHAYYALGQSLQVVQAEFGTMGVMICADASTGNHEIFRTLSYMGADVILSPCSWAVRPIITTLRNPMASWWREAYKPESKPGKGTT